MIKLLLSLLIFLCLLLVISCVPEPLDQTPPDTEPFIINVNVDVL